MEAHPKPEAASSDTQVRALVEGDLPAADRIMRVAFGTFLGMPDPASFGGDASYVRTRWLADPHAAFGAELGGELIGSNFATNWGSVGYFGPLTIRPDMWDRGVGKRLMEPIMECFTRWGTAHAGLFTFAHSQKHVGLYQRFGFWPRFLTAIVSKAVAPPAVQPLPSAPSSSASRWTRFSGVAASDRDATLRACRELTGEIFDGLDVTREIDAVAGQKLGDTALLWGDTGLAGLAVCHIGAGSEAGSGNCYVKFGAARPGPNATGDFARMLDACETIAARGGAARLTAGINTARHEAYRLLLARKFRVDYQGVTMHRPNAPGYSRPGVYLLDDWR